MSAGFLFIELLLCLSVVGGVMTVLAMLYGQSLQTERRVYERLQRTMALISYADIVRVGASSEVRFKKYYEGYTCTVEQQKDGQVTIYCRSAEDKGAAVSVCTTTFL